MDKIGLIQTYTGSGKGKSTSAFGLAFRAVGQGWNVLITQFMKGDTSVERIYGELKSCKIFRDNITIIQSHDKVPYKVILEHNKSDEDKVLVREAWLSMTDELNQGMQTTKTFFEGTNYEGGWMSEYKPYNMLILDEILGALNLGLISQKTFFEFIKQIREEKPNLEIVLTGRIWSEPLYDKVKDISDLMSDIRAVKHYFEKTCPKCKRSFEFRSNYCQNCGGELKTVGLRKGIEF